MNGYNLSRLAVGLSSLALVFSGIALFTPNAPQPAATHTVENIPSTEELEVVSAAPFSSPAPVSATAPVAPLPLAETADAYCPDAGAKGALLACWKTSGERSAIADERHRPGRGPAYARFMDTFWSNMDGQLAAGAPQTVGVTLDMVERAYAAAARTHQAALGRYGVKAYLNVNSVLRGRESGSSAPHAEILVDAKDLQARSLRDNPTLATLLSGKSENEYDDGFSINIRFQKSPGNWVQQGVGASLGRNFALTLDSPASQLVGSALAQGGTPGSGQNYLMSIANNSARQTAALTAH